MSSAARFLTSAAQALSTMSLYEDGHPARDRAVDRAFGALLDLQDETLHVQLTFLGGEVLLGDRPVRELRGWEWGPRLAAGGIQRLEFRERVTRDDFEAFLDEAFARITGNPIQTAEVRQGRPSNIRYGGVGLTRDEDRSASAELEEELEVATLSYSLRDEIQGVEWLHDELREGEGLQLLEAEALVRSLSVAMHGDQAFFVPLVRLKEYDQYTVTHGEGKGPNRHPPQAREAHRRGAGGHQPSPGGRRPHDPRGRGESGSGSGSGVRAPHSPGRRRLPFLEVQARLPPGEQPGPRLRRLRRLADASSVQGCMVHGRGPGAHRGGRRSGVRPRSRSRFYPDDASMGAPRDRALLRPPGAPGSHEGVSSRRTAAFRAPTVARSRERPESSRVSHGPATFTSRRPGGAPLRR